MFDFVVLLIVGAMAVGGFLRGITHEAISLTSWIVAFFAIRLFHTDLSDVLATQFDWPITASIAALLILVVVPIIIVKLVAKKIGKATRNSVFGPIDQVLGFGFGAVKGGFVVIVAFSIVVLGFDTIWGQEGRPQWMTQSRTYPIVNASTNALVEVVAKRRTDYEAMNRAQAAQASPLKGNLAHRNQWEMGA